MALKRQICVNTEMSPIDKMIVKADVGRSRGYLFYFQIIIGYFGDRRRKERAEHTMPDCKDFYVNV